MSICAIGAHKIIHSSSAKYNNVEHGSIFFTKHALSSRRSPRYIDKMHSVAIHTLEWNRQIDLPSPFTPFTSLRQRRHPIPSHPTHTFSQQ